MSVISSKRGFLTLLVCTACACLAGTAQAQVPDLPGWDLVMNDEFNGTSLNTSIWTALNRQDSHNNEKQYYHSSQVAVTGGNLVITATDQPLGNKDYRSGLITSDDLYGQGRFEARIDLPTSQGMWPAFWLNANHIDWPQGGEIDIMENRGSQPTLTSSAYHWQDGSGPCCGGHQYVWHEYSPSPPVDFHGGFHTYAVEWEEDALRFYVDDNLHFTVNSGQASLFDTPKNIILNLAVGGNFGGDPNGSTVWPQTMLVDYVRYWQRSYDPGPGPTALLNPGFDEAGGSLNHWTTFGNSIGNVSAQDENSLDGTHALKMYGQFNGPGNTSGAYQGIEVAPGDDVTADASAYIPTWDTLSGKSNEVFMKLQYYSDFGADFGSADYLGETSLLIADGTTAEGAWRAHQISDTAPAGAEEVRLVFEFLQPGSDNGAIHIDRVGLSASAISVVGDLNGDGFVGIADLNIVLGNWNQSVPPGDPLADPSGDGLVGIEDLNVVLGNWNAGTPPQGSSIPEPATLSLLSLGGLLTLRRRSSDIS